MKEIFENINKKTKLHPTFELLNNFKALNPAKKMINEIANKMIDKDGNFVQQFQTTGFNARLWEMFIYKFLEENNFEIIYKYDRPDFQIVKDKIEFFIEASLSNEKDDDKYSKQYLHQVLKSKNLEIQKELIEYYVMRMGSVLFSKLNKKYWELEWVKDKPLVLAITPSHNYLADFLPDAKIIEYLYGLAHKTEIVNDEVNIISVDKIESHKYGVKEIPSNFFAQENTENISAVIFTNNGNLHKFNRMGYQLGLSEEQLIMERAGASYDPDPKSVMGTEFNYSVTPGELRENWSESVSVFHNPNAIYPLNKDLFKNVRQLWLNDERRFDGFMPDFFVYHSLTISGCIE